MNDDSEHWKERWQHARDLHMQAEKAAIDVTKASNRHKSFEDAHKPPAPEELVSRRGLMLMLGDAAAACAEARLLNMAIQNYSHAASEAMLCSDFDSARMFLSNVIGLAVAASCDAAAAHTMLSIHHQQRQQQAQPASAITASGKE